jgi:hypothetical protein
MVAGPLPNVEGRRRGADGGLGPALRNTRVSRHCIAELQRTAIVFQAALDRHDEPTAAHLARLETLSRLSADERVALLDRFLDRVRADADVDDGWWDAFRATGVSHGDAFDWLTAALRTRTSPADPERD